MRERRRRARAELAAWQLLDGMAPGSVTGDPGVAAGAGAVSIGGRPRVLVIAHVFYPELWDDLAECVRRIPEPAQVVATVVREAGDAAEAILAEFPDARVLTVDNLGRDMRPLLLVLDQVQGYDAVLKLHTKRSPHRLRGDRWRNRLLSDLCPSPEGVTRVLRLLRTYPRVGMVAPDGSVLGREFLGTNRSNVASLAARGGLRFEPDRLWFPAGSMFWARPSVLQALRDVHVTDEDFEPESGALDGTTAHALERYLGVILDSQGLAVVEASEVCSLLSERAAG